MNPVTPTIHVPARIPENTLLLFVYGTLKKGGINHRSYMEHAEFINRTSIEGFTLFTYNCLFPVARPAAGEHMDGEWWLVSEEAFERIARMEYGAGYDLCTVDGQCYFFAIMNETLWGDIMAWGRATIHVGSDWPIEGYVAPAPPAPRSSKRAALTRRCSESCPHHEMNDHCLVCAPYWDSYPVCPDCHTKLSEGASGKVFTCRKCHKRFSWDGAGK